MKVNWSIVNKGVRYTFLIFSFFLLINVSAQEKVSKRKMLTSSIKLIEQKEYDEALELLLKLDSIEGGESYMTSYYIGICYLNSKYDQVKAIPYLEDAIDKDKFLIENKVYNYLGDLYHLDYKFDGAIYSYNRYMLKDPNALKDKDDVEKKIKISEQAKQIFSDSINVNIIKLNNNINGIHSEYSALVNADETILYFTKKKNPDLIENGDKTDSLEYIFVSYKKDSVWTIPNSLEIEGSHKDISLAGSSPDGDQLYLCIKGDLYSCTVIEGKYGALERLPEPINSDSYERNISISADGAEVYFSSDRAGGMGGFDIYRSVLNEKNEWNQPENLGSVVNTSEDEIAPFIHPDKKTLYFSSKSHFNMGGFDIFHTYNKNGVWEYPKNMGYPINTVKDDIYFVLSANGKNGYFSSDISNRYFCHDIYKVAMRNSIPLTMVKGLITAGKNRRPVQANIKVIDKETGERIRYVYDPNPKTGKYLMIFPPGKNYEIVVDAEGFIPHHMEVYIPEQDEFYELYQEIHLDSIIEMGKFIGEEMTVKNSFSNQEEKVNNGEEIVKKDYSELFEIMDTLIKITDSIHDNFETESNPFEDVDPFANVERSNKNYDELFAYVDQAIDIEVKEEEKITYDTYHTQQYFYAENGKNDLHPVVIEGDTIWAAPTLKLTKPHSYDSYRYIPVYDTISDNQLIAEVGEEFKKSILTNYICFADNSSKIPDDLKFIIDSMLSLTKKYPNLFIELTGYSDQKVEEKSNLDKCIKLGLERANVVKEHLIAIGLKPERINVKEWNGKRIKEFDKFKCVKISLIEITEIPLEEA
jgi:outer membrane protein OmpA-like peptidoglycan-associated protein